MMIIFLLQTPGNHRIIRSEDDAQGIPRVGDSVVIADVVYTVHSVTWRRAESAVEVALNDT